MEKHWVEVVEILAREPLLYSFMRYCPLEILKAIRVKRYPANSFFLNQGEYYDKLYFVASGELEVYVDASNGKKYHQATYNTGDYLGEMEVFARLPYVSSIRSVTDVELLVLPRAYYLQWLDIDRLFSTHMLRTICQSYYDVTVRTTNNLLYSLKQRICNYLLEQIPYGQQQRLTVEIFISSEKLSEALAVTQRSVTRILKELKEKDIITVTKHSITILNQQALKDERSIQ